MSEEKITFTKTELKDLIVNLMWLSRSLEEYKNTTIRLWICEKIAKIMYNLNFNNFEMVTLLNQKSRDEHLNLEKSDPLSKENLVFQAMKNEVENETANLTDDNLVFLIHWFQMLIIIKHLNFEEVYTEAVEKLEELLSSKNYNFKYISEQLDTKAAEKGLILKKWFDNVENSLNLDGKEKDEKFQN